MKKIRLLLLAFLLVSHGAYGEYLYGNELLEVCEAFVNNTDFEKGVACNGYISGVFDTHEIFVDWDDMKPSWCIPDSVTNAQLIFIVTKYLQENPDKLRAGASGHVINALIKAFPCN